MHHITKDASVGIVQNNQGRNNPRDPTTEGEQEYDQKGATSFTDNGQGRKKNRQKYSEETHFNKRS